MKAVAIAREEEHAKAIKAYREMYCSMHADMSCEFCSAFCTINKFKEILERMN